MRYWLLKTEPTTYSLRDLARDGRTDWEGVRNYQARNLLRDEMQVGDLALIYHSNATPPGVVGLARISGGARPDPHALRPDSRYFDRKATAERNPWVVVEVSFVEEFRKMVALETLKATPALEGMYVTRRGMRLSVQPVEPEHFELVLQLARS